MQLLGKGLTEEEFTSGSRVIHLCGLSRYVPFVGIFMFLSLCPNKKFSIELFQNIYKIRTPFWLLVSAEEVQCILSYRTCIFGIAAFSSMHGFHSK